MLCARDEQDVVAGVRLARERGLKVSVRAGGHSWAVWSVRDDALLIDLGLMQELGYDPATGIATASPAIKGGAELTPFLTAQGRAFPGGHCPSVGIGGFLLQGGQGWNSRNVGWACEHIAAIDVVTADGELIRADEDRNSDLLWAARGAGPGFFGVVTRFHLRTQPLARAMTQDTWTFELDDLEPLLRLDRRAPADTRARRRTRDRRDAPASTRRAAGAAAAHDGDVRHARGGRAGPRAAGRVPDRRPARSPTSGGRPRSSRRTRCRPARTPRTIATRSIARGPTLVRPSLPRSYATCGRSCRRSTRSRSGTAGRRIARCRTWRSRSRGARTSPRMRSGLTRPTTIATATGSCSTPTAWPRSARGCISATRTSPDGLIAS